MDTATDLQGKKEPVAIFEEIIKALDYGTAVVLLKDYLPAHFWANMTICQQVMAYEASSDAGCIELKNMMFNKLARVPNDFAVWHEIFNWVLPDSGLRTLAQVRMVASAKTVEQWEILSLLSQPNTDNRKLALEKVTEISGFTADRKGGY